MDPASLTNRIVLSYIQRDRELAFVVAEVLKEQGFTVWDERDLGSDEPWQSGIVAALKQSDSMIALLSPFAWSSAWVRAQLEHAFFDERYKNRLLPVLLGVSMPEFGNIPWILTRMDFIRLKDNEPTKSRATQIVNAFIEMLKNSAAAK